MAAGQPTGRGAVRAGDDPRQIPYTESDQTRAGAPFRIDPERLAGPMYTACRAAGLDPLPDVAHIVDTTVLDSVFQGRTTV